MVKDTAHLTHDDLRWDECGQSSLSGDLLKLFRSLDQAIVVLADEFQVAEHYFPSLIPLSELSKVDYLHSFPQHATFPVHLAADKDNLKVFSETPLASNVAQLTDLDPVKEILTPAACYHCYINYQHKQLGDPLYLTLKCRCFRNEEHYLPLERQWNFSMREIVCIGSAEEVNRFVETMREKVIAFIDMLGMPVSLEVATDPFFDPSNNPKYIMQKLQPNKTEMVFDEKLAIGSINLHRNYFGESFSIVRDGEPANSACIAFGLERWIAAILRHYGPERRDWPLQTLNMEV